MTISISNIEPKLSREKKGRPGSGGERLIRFSVNVTQKDGPSEGPLLTIHGWLLNAAREVHPPASYGFYGRRVKVYEVSPRLREALVRGLSAFPEVTQHLGELVVMEPPLEAPIIESSDSGS